MPRDTKTPKQKAYARVAKLISKELAGPSSDADVWAELKCIRDAMAAAAENAGPVR